jgi:uncharacterized coiled-coil DUF342 family protein
VSEPVRLDLAEVAAAATRLARMPEPTALASSLVDLVRAWAAPSAAFAAVRDASVEGGWRVLPSVLLGSVPLGVERSLARLAEGAPEALERGGIVQRGDEIAGVKARDNWAVPFWAGEQSGALFLRGVPRPAPENLGEALALATAAAWPRLLGSPAERVEALVGELRTAAEQLAVASGRQLSALEALRTAPPEPTPPEAGPGVAALEAEIRDLESERARRVAETREAQAEAETLRSERDALRERLEKAETAAAQNASLAEQAAEAETLRSERDALRERLEKAETAAAQNASFAEQAAEAETLRSERDALRERLEKAEAAAAQNASLAEQAAEAETLRSERDALRERLEKAEAAAAQNASLAEQAAEAETLRSERDALRERLEKAEAAAAQGAPLAEPVTDADALQIERDALRERLDTARRAAEAADVRARKAEEELAEAQRDLALARARAGQQDQERRERLEEAEARAHAAGEQWETARRALRTATTAVRRAAYLPPAVRVSMQEAAGPDEVRRARAAAALLDRDVLSLEAVADALESAGVDARIASHPEELALLLRTAEAANLGAVVCDVMAFRPDQNVAGLIRAWDRDRPGLAYFLSFDADNAAEVERARRIPTSIIAGHLPRPLAPARLVETLDTLLAKRRGKF